MVILTTGHGLVRGDAILTQHDNHIDVFRGSVKQKWQVTVPGLLAPGRYDLLLFYAGACPREQYLDLLLPILQSIKLPLITFGQPQFADIGHIADVAMKLMDGTTLSEIRDLLTVPEKLEYHPA